MDMNHNNQNEGGNPNRIVSNNSFKILKCGKELISYVDKSFGDLLPKKLQKHGIEFFTAKMSKFVDYETMEMSNSENTNASNKRASNLNNNSNQNGNGLNSNQIDVNSAMFQFVINEKMESHEISLLNYNFKVSRTLIDEHMLIYGYYSGLNTKIMLFQMNKLSDTNNVSDSLNMKLENFSIGIKNILLLSNEWIDILDKANNSVYFNSIFKSFKAINKESYDHLGNVINEKDDKNKDTVQFECLLDYNHYIKSVLRFAKVLKEFLDSEMTNSNNTNKILNKPGQLNEIEQNINKLKEKKGKVLKLKLKLIFEINVNITTSYKVFSVSVLSANQNKKKSNLQDNLNLIQEDIYSNSSSSNKDLKANQTYTNSNTSMTENSMSLRLSQKSRGGKDTKLSAINTQDSKLNRISKIFSMFSVFIVLLNFIIFLVCIIFLIVQISQTNKLNRINNINYEFKRVRIVFAHSFLSVFTNGCLAKLKDRNCLSAYNTYSEELIVNNNFDESYNIRNYLLEEIKYKIDLMHETFYSYKDDLFDYNDEFLLTTLSDEMDYISFEQKDNQLIQQSLSVSLEEGFRKYINSFSILVNNEFEKVPIYIISFRDSTVDFSNMETQNLDDVQTQMYLILINYINYSTIFKNSENKIELKYNDIVKSNKTVLLVFMIFIAFLNVGLLILCLWNIAIVTDLFLHFLIGMIMIMSDNDFKSFYVERIDNLIELAKLYTKNPNSLIHNIKKNEIKIMKKLREREAKNKNLEQQAIMNGEKEYLLYKKKIKNQTERNAYVDVSKIRKILLPFVYKIVVLFTVYFTILIVFDYYLFNQFNQLLSINDYILDNFLVETQMYDILVLTQIMTLLNLTQNDFAKSLQIDNPDSDGVINMKIRETSSYIKKIQNEEMNSEEAFTTISKFFNTKKCSEIYRNIESNLTDYTVNALGIDFYDLQGILCDKFEIMTLDSFEYMFNDYILRAQKLQNLIRDYSYDSLYEFNTQYEFFDLVTMVLFNMQPIRNYIRTVLMDKLMNDTINDFIVLIVIYLCLNILMDIGIYLIIKFAIAGKMDEMRRELLMLNDCFSY